MPPSATSMSTLEYHVLLSMADGPQYGYAIKEAIEADSGGSLQPRAGTLYRVIARLISQGAVAEAEPTEEDPPHPGLTRKYYGLTPSGREALALQAGRLKHAVGLAEKRLGLAEGNR